MHGTAQYRAEKRQSGAGYGEWHPLKLPGQVSVLLETLEGEDCREVYTGPVEWVWDTQLIYYACSLSGNRERPLPGVWGCGLIGIHALLHNSLQHGQGC